MNEHPSEMTHRLRQERDGLAALVEVMRGVLKNVVPILEYGGEDIAMTCDDLLTLTPPDALAEVEARVRGEERERCCQATCHYCLEHAQGKRVSAAYSSSRDEWAHKIYISGIDEPLIRYCRAQAIREADDA